MGTESEIKQYVDSLPESKRTEMQKLHELVLEISPSCQLWFLDGRDDSSKVVSNPNIGYGAYTIQYANGTTRDFYRVGISANTIGISVYIMGLKDKKYLTNTYAETIGKATVTGYCIKFKTLTDIDLSVLESAIRDGLEQER